MHDLKQWFEAKIQSSAHAALLQSPPPAVAGGGDEVLLAIGETPQKVVYLGLRHGGDTLRIGFAAKDRWANEEVEEAVEGSGDPMDEWLADEMEADEDLEYPVQHFHEAGWFHFACDVAKSKAFFATEAGREHAWYYFDGYARVILPIVSGHEEE